MKLLFTAISIFILSSCVTKSDTNKLQPQVTDVDELKKLITYNAYANHHLGCFVFHNKCLHKSWSEEECWDKHEQCVLRVHRMYQVPLGLTPIPEEK